MCLGYVVLSLTRRYFLQSLVSQYLPFLGVTIAHALCEALLGRGCRVAITTHYMELEQLGIAVEIAILALIIAKTVAIAATKTASIVVGIGKVVPTAVETAVEKATVTAVETAVETTVETAAAGWPL